MMSSKAHLKPFFGVEYFLERCDLVIQHSENRFINHFAVIEHYAGRREKDSSGPTLNYCIRVID
jgi:hypothetical protein